MRRLRGVVAQSEARQARIELLEQQLRDAHNTAQQQNHVTGESLKQLVIERDSARMHYEELQNRHTILQRSLQMSEDLKVEGSSAVNRVLNEAEGRTAVLAIQKQQLAGELERARQMLSGAQADHDQEVGKMQADLVATKNELLETRSASSQSRV